jgi:hypothetical protein
MYDIKPLEEEWDNYRKKRRRPLYVAIVLFILLISSAVLLKYEKVSFPSLFNYNKSATPEKIKVSDVLIDKSISSLEVKKVSLEQGAMVPKAMIPKESKHGTITLSDSNPMDPGDVFIEVDERMQKPINQKPINTAMNTRKVEEVEEPRTRKKIHFTMVDASSTSASKEIESRFTESPNTDDSLFLAKMYYSKAKYRKSAYWALQTNKLDGDIEESWLIFARSKAKTGQKNEAIRVLSQYAKKSDSVEAKKLLYKLKSK